MDRKYFSVFKQNKVRKERVQLTVICLCQEFRIGSINYTEINLLEVLDFEYLHWESNLVFLNHERTLLVEVGTTEIKIINQF